FVLSEGLVGFTLFAIAFAEAEDGRGGQLARFVHFSDDGLVGLDGGREIVIGFLLEQTFLKGGAEIVGRRAPKLNHSKEGQARENHPFCSHKVPNSLSLTLTNLARINCHAFVKSNDGLNAKASLR